MINAATQIDYTDVQGLVRFGYKTMTEACYYLLRIKDASAAAAWLRTAPVTSAVELTTPPPSALQIALTADGLEALGVPASVIAGFSDEFIAGIAGDESRSRRLGDVGVNAPSQWRWGGPGRVPHLVVMLFAQPGKLEGVKRDVARQTWDAAFDVLACLDTSDLGGFEPFGFTDGISQPVLDWPQQRSVKGDQLDYSNVVALGEFLLGYRNEYRKFTDRPVVSSDSSSADLLPADDAPSMKDVGRNGTYVVMRSLQQDVRGFWQLVQRQTGKVASAPDELASAFVGRLRNGDSLLPSQSKSIPGIGPDPQQIRQNQFTFDDDAEGLKCPFGSHIRRANPRNADYPGRPAGTFARLVALLGLQPRTFRDDLTSSVRFHRILRRGREYGPGLPPADALAPAPPDDPERGLRFICLNANIARQFEFLQNAWVMNTKFNGLSSESDPLLGNRQPIPGCPVTDDCTIPQNGCVQRVSGLPQFVTVQGGAYFFLPSLRALQYFVGFARKEG
jgi:deferrochelatase/peroxidase EfeB